MMPGLLTGNPIGHKLLRDLAGYWPLDEASGTRRDLSGNANTLTDNNTVTGNPGPSSKLPLASQFTAANDEFLTHASNAALQGGNISQTVAVWCYLDSKVIDRFLIGKQDGVGAGGNREFNLAYGITADRYLFQLFAADGVTATGTATASSFGVPPTATWVFLMAWVDIAANTASIQANNGPVDASALTGTPGATAGQFIVGALATTNRQWDGRIAGASRWKRVLSAAERAYLYNGGAGRAYQPGRGFV